MGAAVPRCRVLAARVRQFADVRATFCSHACASRPDAAHRWLPRRAARDLDAARRLGRARCGLLAGTVPAAAATLEETLAQPLALLGRERLPALAPHALAPVS